MGARFCKCGAVVNGEGCRQCRSTPGASTTYKTTKQRGYGADWKELSERYRKHHPLCEDCLANDKTVPACEVHHIVPISVDPSLRLEWANLAALCNTCHAGRHVAE